jgi:sortase A
VQRRTALLLLAPLLVGCATETAPAPESRRSVSAVPTPSATPPPAPEGTPSATPSVDAGPTASDGTPRRALLSIPALDIDDLVVVPYDGFTDDAPGTAIQARGRAASPHGPLGGTGPGGIGNYQVTAHRLSSTRAFEFLPRLRVGQRVHVEAGGVRYTYEVTTTRETSFRSPRSLREQRAAVPGEPGETPTVAMITLSTCATIENHAEGNYWSDEFGNPEHRIDKIGVLVEARRT